MWTADEDDINHEELSCVRNAWQQTTYRANEAQEQWGDRVHYQLEKGFARVVRVSFPSMCYQHSAASTVRSLLVLPKRLVALVAL